MKNVDSIYCSRKNTAVEWSRGYGTHQVHTHLGISNHKRRDVIENRSGIVRQPFKNMTMPLETASE